MNQDNENERAIALLEEIRATQLEQAERAEKRYEESSKRYQEAADGYDAYTKSMEKYAEYVLEYNGKFEKWEKADPFRIVLSVVIAVGLIANVIVLILLLQRL